MKFEEFKKITSEYQGNLIGNMFQNFNTFVYEQEEDGKVVKKKKQILSTITLKEDGSLIAEESTYNVIGGTREIKSNCNENCLRQMLKEYNFKLKSGYQLSLFL